MSKRGLVAIASSTCVDTFLAKWLVLVTFDLSDSSTVEHDHPRADLLPEFTILGCESAIGPAFYNSPACFTARFHLGHPCNVQFMGENGPGHRWVGRRV